jgi:hypothetical protein
LKGKVVLIVIVVLVVVLFVAGLATGWIGGGGSGAPDKNPLVTALGRLLSPIARQVEPGELSGLCPGLDDGRIRVTSMPCTLRVRRSNDTLRRLPLRLETKGVSVVVSVTHRGDRSYQERHTLDEKDNELDLNVYKGGADVALLAPTGQATVAIGD